MIWYDMTNMMDRYHAILGVFRLIFRHSELDRAAVQEALSGNSRTVYP